MQPGVRMEPLPPHPKIAEQLRELQELTQLMGNAQLRQLREKNRIYAADHKRTEANCAQMDKNMSKLKKDVSERDETIARLKELFASKRGIALPSASYPLSRTSLTDSEEPEDDQENAKPKQEQESAALTRRHDEAPCSIKQDEAARQARLRPAVKRPGVGSRVEAERARLEKVDEQRRSLKQRRDAEAAYEEGIKSRDSEIKVLKQKLARAKEQIEAEAMQKEQELFIAKQTLKHV